MERYIERGWIYWGHRAIPVDVLDALDTTYRVRFPTRKFGLRNRIGTVPKDAVNFTPPHLKQKDNS